MNSLEMLGKGVLVLTAVLALFWRLTPADRIYESVDGDITGPGAFFLC